MLNIWNLETEELMLKKPVDTWIEVQGWLDYFKTRYHIMQLVVCRYDEETETYYYVN